MFITLAFVRGEIRVIHVVFEGTQPIAVMENGSQMPLDADLLRHVKEVQPVYFYELELIPP